MKNIFISSTFRDMQAERDLVQEKVLPALRAEARKYGDNVGTIDLRWGVDTSALETEEGSAKVLTVCLDEIERSHPYMLIFLGERYGWIPRKNLLENAIRNRGDKYVTEDFEKSVTALEIEYGALSEKYGDLNHCIICFREPVTPFMDAETADLYKEQEESGKQKLAALKERIRQELGADDRLLTYTCDWDAEEGTLKNFMIGKEPLEEVLIRCFIEMFRADWKEFECLSWQEREQLGFQSLMENKLRSFVGREALLERYYQKIKSGTTPIILQGEAGSGKTSLMSKLAERLKNGGENVCPLFCGAGNMSTSAELLVRQMVYYVETMLSVTHNPENMSYEEYLERLKILCAGLKENVYFVIDALDQLLADDHVEKLDFLITGKHVRMILSCTDTFELTAAATVGTEAECIPALCPEDAKTVIQGILKADSRDSYTELEQELVKKQNIGNPLYISLLLKRLNMMDGEELLNVHTGQEIASYVSEVIRSMPDTLQGAAVNLLEVAWKRINSSGHQEMKEILRYLAVSRNGLRTEDLQKIFEARKEIFSVLDFTRFLRYMDSFFYMGEQDRVDFSHKIIRQGVLEKITDRERYEEDIKSYIETLEPSDYLRMREGIYYAGITKDYDFARSLLAEACELQREEVFHAIKEQAIADEGLFFCQMLCWDNTEDSKERDVLYYLHERLDLSEKEMKVKMNLAKALVYSAGELYKRRSSRENLLELGRSHNRQGDALSAQGRHEEALGCYKETLICYEAALPCERSQGGNADLSELLNLSTGYHNIGYSLEQLGRSEEALIYYEKALHQKELVYEREKSVINAEKLILGYNSCATLLNALGRKEEALILFEKAVLMADKLYEEQGTNTDLGLLAVCHSNMSGALREAEHYAEALIHGKKAVSYGEEFHGIRKSLESLHRVAIGYNTVGKALYAAGAYGEALDYYDKSLKYTKKIHEEQKSMASLCELMYDYVDICAVLRCLERYEEAAACYKELLRCGEEMHELDAGIVTLQNLYDSYETMAYMLEETGRFKEADIYYQKMRACMRKMYDQQDT